MSGGEGVEGRKKVRGKGRGGEGWKNRKGMEWSGGEGGHQFDSALDAQVYQRAEVWGTERDRKRRGGRIEEIIADGLIPLNSDSPVTHNIRIGEKRREEGGGKDGRRRVVNTCSGMDTLQ